jgi:hypothetical protein
MLNYKTQFSSKSDTVTIKQSSFLILKGVLLKCTQTPPEIGEVHNQKPQTLVPNKKN